MAEVPAPCDENYCTALFPVDRPMKPLFTQWAGAAFGLGVNEAPLSASVSLCLFLENNATSCKLIVNCKHKCKTCSDMSVLGQRG